MHRFANSPGSRPRSACRGAGIATAAAATLLMTAAPASADGTSTAGGTPLADLVPAAIVGAVLVCAVAAFGWEHRRGHTRILTRLAGVAERAMGVPGFAALPAALAGGALLVAVFGF